MTFKKFKPDQVSRQSKFLSKMSLSAHAYDHILKVARMIAALIHGTIRDEPKYSSAFHGVPASLRFDPGHDVSGSSHFDELAFWFLICRSFTTCCTFGTEEAIFSASARLDCELTSPVSVTTPFLTSYLTLF
jgi:hypothetical protein